MATPVLVDADIREGEELLRRLDEQGVVATSAMWLFFPEPDEWRLVLALSLVRREGPRAAYEVIRRTLQKYNLGVPLSRVQVVSPDELIIRRIGRAVATEPKAIAGIRFTNSAIGDVLIEDAHIYRST